MSTLLLRYAAPLAAFGHSARFDDRASATTPTLSGIQGLIAAAAGIGRNSPWPEWIALLHLAIRVDHTGTRISDYHTVNQPPARPYRGLDPADLDRVRVLANADGGRASFDTFVSHRGYVADATFLVAVDDPTGEISQVLTDPTWALYAGRKSCPLTEPFVLGHTAVRPEDAIASVPTVSHPANPDLNRMQGLVAEVFTMPDGPGTFEDRHDRATGFKAHRPQRRWQVEVAVPVVEDWFVVIDQLRGAPA
jgi:CRISPR system Cascade subunit CasD